MKANERNAGARVFSDPIPKGASEGSLLTRDEFERMLDDYYQVRGWSQNGVPTWVRLALLGLDEVAERNGAR